MSESRPSPPEVPDRLDAIRALAEPNRRALYEYVARTGGWISRDQAADAVGLERGTTAHHLDRLAADGLLDVDYRRLSGRQGPGAGRTAKLYRRARREFGVSLPPRDYELAGRLLAAAADRSRSDRVDIVTALDQVARDEGQRLAGDARSRLNAGEAGERPAARRQAVLRALDERGFEPAAGDDGTVILRNCPFHQLAREHRELICGMNLSLLEAAIEGVGETGFDALLDPSGPEATGANGAVGPDGTAGAEEPVCCVRLVPQPGARAPD